MAHDLDPQRAVQPTDLGPSAACSVPDTARLILCGPHLPPFTDAVLVAHALRNALLALSDAAPVFLGRAADGQPLRGHVHAHILPEAWGPDQAIRYVTLYAPMGLDERAQQALQALHLLRLRRDLAVPIACLGLGQGADFAGSNIRAGQCPLLEQARSWVSRTPFVPTRHGKNRNSQQVGTVAAPTAPLAASIADLRRLLLEAHLPDPVSIEPLSDPELPVAGARWNAFQVQRPGGQGSRGAGSAMGYRLEFEKAVRGPIALGYNAHFGLGQFAPG